MSDKNMLADDRYELDPVFVHARRETLVIIALFSAFCLWSVFVCYQSGYLAADEQIAAPATVLGIPAWAFWGIFLPWILVDVIAVWFCFFFMKNDDLGEAHEDEDLAEQIEEMEHPREHADD